MPTSPLPPKTYCEQRGDGWRFVRRLNPKKGAFPWLEEGRLFKLTIVASSEQDAVARCRELSRKFDVLQLVSREDRSKRFTTLEYEEAAEALFTFMQFDLRKYHERMNSAAYQDTTYINLNKVVVDDIKQFYSAGGRDTYTFFGDYLVKLIDQKTKLKPALSEALTSYFNKSRGTRQDWTEKNKNDVIRYVDLFEKISGKRPFDLIQRKDTDQYIAERTQKVAATSVKREITALSAVWSYCTNKYEHLGRNPFTSPDLPAYKSKTREGASLDDSRQLYSLLTASKPESYVKPMILIALLTGARLGEAWGIAETDVDLNKQLFYIRPNSTRRTKNNATIRALHLTPTLRNAIDAMNSLGKAKTANAASASATKYFKAQGFQFTTHGLRHGCRDRYDELRARFSDIEVLLGWSSGGMVRHYGSGELTKTQRDLMVELENYLKSTIPENSNV